MNLLNLASGQVQGANPNRPIAYKRSIGYSAPSSSNAFVKTPLYATEADFTASLTSTILDVRAVTQGKIELRQTLSGPGIGPGTLVQKQLTGTPGGIGTYQIAGQPANAASAFMSTLLTFMGQEQALQYKDLKQLDAINQNGTRRKFYLYGVSAGVVRSLEKGGDLIIDSYGAVWLVVIVFEQWQRELGWCSVGVTLQDNA